MRIPVAKHCLCARQQQKTIIWIWVIIDICCLFSVCAPGWRQPPQRNFTAPDVYSNGCKDKASFFVRHSSIMHMSGSPTRGAAQQLGRYTGRLTAKNHWRFCDKWKSWVRLIWPQPPSSSDTHAGIQYTHQQWKDPSPCSQECLCHVICFSNAKRSEGMVGQHTRKVEHFKIYTPKKKKILHRKIASSL